VTRAKLTLALAVLCAAPAARAEGFVLKHVATLYADAREAGLKSPEGVACNDDGRVVVADTGNARLLSWTVLAGTVQVGLEWRFDQLRQPVKAAFEKSGSLLVLDRQARRLARIDPAGAWGGWVEWKGAPGVPVPLSFAVDPAGAIYLLDAAGPAVAVFGADGAFQRRVALPAGGHYTDLWADAGGGVFVVDPTRAAVLSAARGDAAFRTITQKLTEEVAFPATITGNGRGRLLLVDQHGMGVVVLGLDGSYQGRQLSLGWNDGLVYYPAQLCINGKGEAFLADRGNNRVQVFTTGN